MPKNKRIKYQKIQSLPNVTISDEKHLRSSPPVSYPWDAPTFQNMEVILELGCGKGEHTLAFAMANPRRLCIGVDFKSHRLCVGAENALSEGLDNVHFLRARIEDIQHFFTHQAIREIWLTFPDPHPKQRSIKHRLTSPGFLDAYAHLLIPGGKLHLKTDSDLLFNYTLASVKAWGGSILYSSTNIHAHPPTDAPQTSLPISHFDTPSPFFLLSTPDTKTISTPSIPAISAFERNALSQGCTIKYMACSLHTK